MNDVIYWGSELSKLQNNPPKSTTNAYNKSFVDRMNEAQANIDNLVTEKDKAWSATQQAKEAYDTYKGTMSSYEDVYKNSKADFGVEQRQDEYEKSKEALEQINRAMDMLPSSINKNAEVRLTQSQREASYNRQMNVYNKMMETGSSNSNVFKDVWDRAREEHSTYVQAEIASQTAKLEGYSNAWMKARDNFNQKEEEWRNARLEKQQIGSYYRVWQLNQKDIELTTYLNKLSNALKRYTSAMETQIYQNEKNMAGHEQLQAYFRKQDQDAKEKLANNLINWYQDDTLGKNRKSLLSYNGSGGGGGSSW